MINTTKQILMQMDVKEEARMEIKKPAIAGTLESSDCQVTVEAGEGRNRDNTGRKDGQMGVLE